MCQTRMEFDRTTTAFVFLGLIVVSAVGVSLTPMTPSTLYMMVLPSMVVFGLIMLALGVKHGEHRAGHR